jgi:hypothetical protein
MEKAHMEIKLSDHLRQRLLLRSITEETVREVFLEADAKYQDEETSYLISVKRMRYEGKERDLMVASMERQDSVLLLTIHPLKAGQRENRIASGRWKPL